MEISIKGNKIKLIFILAILISCKSINNTNGQFILLFSSVYDNDLCNLKINEKTYYKYEPIKTNRSLGVDLKKEIYVSSNIMKMEISFTGIIDKEFDLKKTIKLDTILHIKNGRFIMINTRNSIIIKQQNSPFILD